MLRSHRDSEALHPKDGTPGRSRYRAILVFVGWSGALPEGLPASATRERIAWLGNHSGPEPLAVILGPDAFGALSPPTLQALLRGGRAPVFVCAAAASPRQIQAWIRAGATATTPRELAADLAPVLSGRLSRPPAAVEATREALRRGAPASPASPSTQSDILDSLHDLSSMNVAEWCGSIGMTESAHKRRCRREWGRPPHAILDLYVAEVARILAADRVPPADIARALGYAGRRGLDRVLVRVAARAPGHGASRAAE